MLFSNAVDAVLIWNIIIGAICIGAVGFCVGWGYGKLNNMPKSYKLIFIASIFMVFFVLLAGAATKSKSSGFGMLIWGYTAWRCTSDASLI